MPLAAADEYPHGAELDSPDAHESYYFDFYDPEVGISGYTSIGFRHHKGYMGSITGIATDDHVYLRKALGRITESEAIRLGGVVYEPVAPLDAWRLRELGTTHRFDRDETDEMLVSPREFPVGTVPLEGFEMELTFSGLQAPYDYYTDASEDELAVISSLYRRHYEQPCAVQGDVTIGDTTHEIDCYGERDHSWGTRNWVGIGDWDWFSVVVDEETALSCIEVENDHGRSLDGFLMTEGTMTPVTDLTIARGFDGHEANFEFEVATADGRTVEGTAVVDAVLPVSFDRNGETGIVRRCPTTYTLSTGRTVYGWSDY